MLKNLTKTKKVLGKKLGKKYLLTAEKRTGLGSKTKCLVSKQRQNAESFA